MVTIYEETRKETRKSPEIGSKDDTRLQGDGLWKDTEETRFGHVETFETFYYALVSKYIYIIFITLF